MRNKNGKSKLDKFRLYYESDKLQNKYGLSKKHYQEKLLADSRYSKYINYNRYIIILWRELAQYIVYIYRRVLELIKNFLPRIPTDS